MTNIVEMLILYDVAKRNGFYEVAQFLLEVIEQEIEINKINDQIEITDFKTVRIYISHSSNRV